MTEKIHKNREEFQHISEGGGDFLAGQNIYPCAPCRKWFNLSITYI